MSIHRRPAGTCVALVVAVLPLLSGCATRPVNRRLLQYENTATYQFEKMEQKRGASDNLVILAFSGGGTRAAALAYGSWRRCDGSRSRRPRGARCACSTRWT